MPGLDPQIAVLSILAVSLALFLTDALRYDVVALLVVLALAATGTLAPSEAFAGFASEPVVVVAALSLFGHVLTRLGVGDALSRRFVSAGGSEGLLVLRIVGVSAVLASLLSDVAVVAILLPLVSAAASARGVPLARYLLAVSYGAFLGDLLLLVGSAKNLAVNGVLAARGAETFGVFGFTHYGLIVLVVGALWLAWPGRALLPRGAARAAPAAARAWTGELVVESTSTLVNRGADDLPAILGPGLAVLGFARAGESETVPLGAYDRLRPGDALVVRGAAADLLRARDALVHAPPPGSATVEALVPPGSDLIGTGTGPASKSQRRGLDVVAVARTADGTARPAAGGLSAGDALLVRARVEALETARADGQVVTLSEMHPPRMGRSAWCAVALLAAVLVLPLFSIVPLQVSALGGVVGLVLLGSTRADEAWRHVDWPVVALLGGMLALGRAFEIHGLAHGAAQALLGGLGAEPSATVVLVALLLGSTLLAQTTTSIATAVILTPVALSMAAALGVSDRAFVLAVLTGANCAFLSPIAHPAGAMIVGPGGLRFRDFLKAGAPLTAIVLGVAAVVLPWLWPYHPAGG